VLRSARGACPRAEAGGSENMVTKRDIAILLSLVTSVLCVTLYRAWIDPLQALAALAIVVVTVIGLTAFT
jgi:hypothetical protein